MQENCVIELSSDSSAPASPGGDAEHDRIAALINKYNRKTSGTTKRECISDSDEETVILSDNCSDKSNAIGVIEEKPAFRFVAPVGSKGCASSKSDSCFADYDQKNTFDFVSAASARLEGISDSDESTDKEIIAVNCRRKGNKEFDHESNHKPANPHSDSDVNFAEGINENIKVPFGRLETISDYDESISAESTPKNIKRKSASEGNDEKAAPKKRRCPVDKEAKRLEKLAQQQKKKEEREQKKQEAKREKSLKRALSAASKNAKPNECVKFITVHIDADILNETYGTEVLTHLKNTEIQYKVSSQTVPYTVTWSRKVETHLMNDNGELVVSSEVKATEDVLLVMDCKIFVNHVHNSSLLAEIKSVLSIYENKRLYLGVYGLEAYFKHTKSLKQKEIKEMSQKSSKSDKIFADVPVITKRAVEYALTELQIFCNCCHRMLETPYDVAVMIGQFTKAVAQLPYKLEKHLKNQEADWFMAGDKKDTVGVDKDGNGLQRLWSQQLCCFPLARLEVAEAITAQYATPAALIKAYQNCDTKEGERLLQDIPIRRAVGPLTSIRKIGPELSKKIFAFFTTTDENVLL